MFHKLTNNFKRIFNKKLLIYAIAYVVLLLFLFFPTPYEILLPGGVSEAGKIIEIESSPEKSGVFYSSYVSVITKPSSFRFLLAKFNSGADIEKLSKSTAKLSVNEINKSSEIDKLSSIQTSIIVAYREAGKALEYTEAGVIVSYISPNFKAYQNLKIGDIIVAVNGEKIKNIDQFKYRNEKLSCNEDIKFTIIRNNNTTLTINTKKTLVEECKLGINIYNYYDNFVANPKFSLLDTEGLGSSAGLMQTLSIYNQLIDEDLTHGLKIAGTGVIDLNGNILPISGIKQKVFGSIKNNVDIYFVPNTNNLFVQAKIAKEIKNDDIIIVPVTTFADAVKYLREYKK